jgi:hypothetical protein
VGQVCFKVWQKTRQGRCDPAINDRLVGVHWSVDSLRGTPHDPHLGPHPGRFNDRLVGVHWSVDSLRGTPHDPHLGPHPGRFNDRLVGVHWSVDSLRGTPHDPHLGPDWEALTRVGVLVRGGAELVKAAGASKEPDECAGESLSGGGCRKTVLRASMDGLNRAT